MTNNILYHGWVANQRRSALRSLHSAAEDLATAAARADQDPQETTGAAGFYSELCAEILGIIAKIETRQLVMETPPLSASEDGPAAYKTNGVFTA